MVKADFHTHTTASDGSFTPKELIQLAHQQGIRYIAVTDHDTIEGLEEARKEAESYGITLIPGIELSLDYPGIPGSIHVLGFYIDYREEKIQRYIQILKDYRKERNLMMFSKLKKLGFNINPEDFPDIPLDKLGRAHIAKKLYEKHYVHSINEAFENYLKKGEKAYVNKKRYSIEEGIDLIHSLKGVACLAHPYTLKLNNNQLELFIHYLKDNCNLDALEVFYPEHSPRFIDFYYELASKYNLIVMGGSDFHGENKPDLKLGQGFLNQSKVQDFREDEIIKALLEKRSLYDH